MFFVQCYKYGENNSIDENFFYVSITNIKRQTTEYLLSCLMETP